MEIRPSAIIKLGGSLFGLPDLVPRLSNFLGDFSRPRPILVCGGGPSVDLIRRWDRIYNLGEEESHWIALRILSVNSSVVARMLPELFELVTTREDSVAAWRRGRVPVYDPFHYIIEIDELSADPLPRRWRVTSDSIAASMAVRFGAHELVLLKSVTLPERMSMVEAADEDLVDLHFPVVARMVPRVVTFNLRGDHQEEKILYVPEGTETDARAL